MRTFGYKYLKTQDKSIYQKSLSSHNQPLFIWHVTCHFIGSRAIRIFVTTRSEHMVRSLQCHWLFALLPDPIRCSNTLTAICWTKKYVLILWRPKYKNKTIMQIFFHSRCYILWMQQRGLCPNQSKTQLRFFDTDPCSLSVKYVLV